MFFGRNPHYVQFLFTCFYVCNGKFTIIHICVAEDGRRRIMIGEPIATFRNTTGHSTQYHNELPKGPSNQPSRGPKQNPKQNPKQHPKQGKSSSQGSDKRNSDKRGNNPPQRGASGEDGDENQERNKGEKHPHGSTNSTYKWYCCHNGCGNVNGKVQKCGKCSHERCSNCEDIYTSKSAKRQALGADIAPRVLDDVYGQPTGSSSSSETAEEPGHLGEYDERRQPGEHEGHEEHEGHREHEEHGEHGEPDRPEGPRKSAK